MNYNQYVQAVQLLVDVPDSDTDFTTLVPRMIEYAELRLFRELDFIHTTTTSTASLTANVRDVAIPSDIIIVRSANLVTPSATAPAAGIRRPMLRVGYDFVDSYWPAAGTSVAGVYPKFFALLSDTEAVVAPTPDAAYQVEFVGTFRPAPLSEDNPETFLSVNLPDIFLTASLIFASDDQQDDATRAMYEKQYAEQLVGVNIETIRQKAASVSWSPYQPTPQANQQRDRGNGISAAS